MKTNFTAFKEIQKHYEHYKSQIKWGLLEEREHDLIKSELELEEKSLVELQNTRDFAVCYFSQIAEKNRKDAEKERFIWDMISAITFVIDCEKINKGGRV